MQTQNYIIQGRPHGGVAILRHKYLSNKITVLMTGNKRICAIPVNISDKQSVLIITVYMPCVSRSHSPDEEYIDVLNNVEQPLVQSSCNYVIIYVMLYYVIIISTQHTCHSSWRMLFCIMCGITQMPNVITHNYLNYDLNQFSCIDHFMVSGNIYRKVANCSVWDQSINVFFIIEHIVPVVMHVFHINSITHL